MALITAKVVFFAAKVTCTEYCNCISLLLRFLSFIDNSALPSQLSYLLLLQHSFNAQAFEIKLVF